MNLAATLRDGLNDLDISLNDFQIEQLLDYLNLLERWNKSYNLTAIVEPEKMLYYHLLDSLAIVHQLRDVHLALDVGSGAGLPGLPLAIALPDSKWTLLDSNGKKTRFMQQALAVCKVDNAEVVKSRVEDYYAPSPLDMIISRAYASLGNFTASVKHLLSSETKLMTMKTGLDDQEALLMDTTLYTLQEFELRVPGISERRSLVVVEQK